MAELLGNRLIRRQAQVVNPTPFQFLIQRVRFNPNLSPVSGERLVRFGLNTAKEAAASKTTLSWVFQLQNGAIVTLGEPLQRWVTLPDRAYR